MVNLIGFDDPGADKRQAECLGLVHRHDVDESVCYVYNEVTESEGHSTGEILSL